VCADVALPSLELSRALQLREERGRRLVLPPAGTPIPSISGGSSSLGCVGDPRLLARWCRVGPRSSRFRFPGAVGEAVTAAARRNKSLRLLHRLGGAFSGVGEGLVRAGSDGAGCLAAAGLLPVLGDSEVGDMAAILHPGMAWRSPVCCRGLAVGLRFAGWVDRFSFLAVRRRGGRIHGQRSSGCVPGRCAFFVLLYCGSCQSFAAMGFLLVSEFMSSCSGAGHGHGGGRRRRRRRLVATASAKDLLDFVVFFSFFRVFCANVRGQLVPLYASSRCLYRLGLVHVYCLV